MGLKVMIVVALGFACPVAAGLFKVWVHQQTVIDGYELAKEERTHRRILEEVRTHEVQLASEYAPHRLKDLAGKLELAPPSSQNIISVVDGDK